MAQDMNLLEDKAGGWFPVNSSSGFYRNDLCLVKANLLGVS